MTSATMDKTRFTLALGFLGAALLVLSAAFLTPGKLILIPYFLMLFAFILVLRAQKVLPFSDRFQVAFGAFMLASIALYIALLFSSGGIAVISLTGHVWRLLVVAMIGAAVNAAVAQITAPA